MKDALVNSVRAHMPSAHIVAEEVSAPETVGPIPSNHHKLKHWVEFVRKTPGKIILLDADMIVTTDLSDVWGGWDAAITMRTNAPMPINAGAVYLNDTDGARRFMERWWYWELEYVNNKEKYHDWYKKYCGPNQTALGFMLNDPNGLDFKLEQLPCATWNACPDDYKDLSNAKVIHYKARMQDFALSDAVMKKVPEEYKEGVRIWRKYAAAPSETTTETPSNTEANTIPTMGANIIADQLREYAGKSQIIVEIGAWLGHGTKIMAEATSGTVHTYDRFAASNGEVRKAREQGVFLKEGQDTLPLVKSWLPDNVVFHKATIKQSTWDGTPIDLLVDDASKTHSFDHVVNTFFPHLRPGAFVVLMDFNYPPCQNQRDYMATRDDFEPIDGARSIQIFQYRGPR